MKILCPTDFSGCSIKAVQFAAYISAHLNGKLNLLHVVQPQDYFNDTTPISMKTGFEMNSGTQSHKTQIQAAKEANTKLTQIAQRIAQGVYHTCDVQGTLAVFGEAVECVNAFAKKNNIDLIVTGTVGASGLKEVFVGSNTSKMVTNSPCDVLVVPRNINKMQVKHVFFGIESYEADDLKMVERAITFSRAFKAFCHIVHIDTKHKKDDDDTKYEIKIDIDTDYENHAVETVYMEKKAQNIESVIAEYIKLKKIDVCVMYRKHRNFFQRLTHKSQTKKMALHTTVPLLILK